MLVKNTIRDTIQYYNSSLSIIIRFVGGSTSLEFFLSHAQRLVSTLVEERATIKCLDRRFLNTRSRGKFLYDRLKRLEIISDSPH